MSETCPQCNYMRSETACCKCGVYAKAPSELAAPSGSSAISDTLFQLWWRGDGWTTDETKAVVMARDDAERLKRKSWSHDPYVQVTSPPNAAGELQPRRTTKSERYAKRL